VPPDPPAGQTTGPVVSTPHAATAALPLPHQTEIVLHRLLAHLTLWQCQMLVDHLDRVLTGGGYGEVTIVMERGHTRRLRVTLSADITPVPELTKRSSDV